MKKTAVLLATGLVMLTSCSGEKKEEKKTSSSLKEKISTSEKSIEAGKSDEASVMNLVAMYQRYADSLPNDSLSPVYLMKASDRYHYLGMHTQKCHMYMTVIKRFPKFRDLDMTIYLLASSLDSDLDNRPEAKKYYSMYVEKYPGGPYANDARARLETIDSLSFTQLQDQIFKNHDATVK